MCYSPILVKSNKVQYRNGIDKAFYHVPCGHCAECQRQKADDWFVRIYYEWLDYTRKGGRVVFITCTYNDDELPVLDTSDESFRCMDLFMQNYLRGQYAITEPIRSDFIGKVDRFTSRYNCSVSEHPVVNVKRFDKNHCRNFFKSLRQILNREKILRYDSPEQIKYFLVTEYGSPEFTMRPHYHILLFVPFCIDDARFLEFCREAWSHRVKLSDCPGYICHLVDVLKKNKVDCRQIVSTPNGKNWHDWYISYSIKTSRCTVSHSYGFVNYSKEFGAAVTSIDGCRYITDYLSYYDNVLKNELYDRLKDYYKLFPPQVYINHLDKLCKCLSMVRDVFPFRLSSQRFGFLLYQELGLDGKLYEDEKIDFLVKNEILLPNEKRKYRIPQYLINRLMYDDDSVPYSTKSVRLLSDVGLKVLKASLDNKIDYKVRRYKETVIVLSRFVIKDDLDKWHELYPHMDLFKCVFPDLFIDYKSIALYDISFRNVVNDTVDVSGLSTGVLLESASSLFDCQVYSRRKFDFDYFYDGSLETNYLRSRLFNYIPQFEYMENFLVAVEFIRKCVLHRDWVDCNFDPSKKSAVRNALNNFIYT